MKELVFSYNNKYLPVSWLGLGSLLPQPLRLLRLAQGIIPIAPRLLDPFGKLFGDPSQLCSRDALQLAWLGGRHAEQGCRRAVLAIAAQDEAVPHQGWRVIPRGEVEHPLIETNRLTKGTKQNTR